MYRRNEKWKPENLTVGTHSVAGQVVSGVCVQRELTSAVVFDAFASRPMWRQAPLYGYSLGEPKKRMESAGCWNVAPSSEHCQHFECLFCINNIVSTTVTWLQRGNITWNIYQFKFLWERYRRGKGEVRYYIDWKIKHDGTISFLNLFSSCPECLPWHYAHLIRLSTERYESGDSMDK